MGDTNIFSNINNLISGAIKKVAQNVTTSTTDATSTTDTTSTTDATSTTNTNGAQKTQGTTPKNPVDMAQDIKNKELKNDENDKVVCIIGYDEDNDKGISVGEFGKFIKDAYGEDQFEEEQINFLFNVLDSSEPEKADNQDEKADTSKGDIYTAQAVSGDEKLNGAELHNIMTADALEKYLDNINKDEIETLNDGFELQQDGTYKKTLDDGSEVLRTIEKQDNGVTIVEDGTMDEEGNFVPEKGHRTDSKGRLQSDWEYGKDSEGNETKLGTWYEYDEEGNQSVNTFYEFTYHDENNDGINETAELRKWNSDEDDAVHNKPEDKDLDYLFEIEYEDDGITEKSRIYTQEENGNTIVGQYDNIGQRKSEEETDANGNVVRNTEYQVNLANNDNNKTSETINKYEGDKLVSATTTTNKDGIEVTDTKSYSGFEYDNDGRATSGTIIHTDENETTTEEILTACELDENGNVVKGTTQIKKLDGTIIEKRTYTDCEYNKDGTVNNGKIEYSDENGNVVKTEEYEDGSVIDLKEYSDFEYDEDGKVKSGTIIHTDKDGVKTTETLADCELDENGNVVKGKIEYSDENGNVVKTEEYKDGSVIDFKEYINFAPNKDGLVTSGTIIHTDENETTTEETLTDCVLQNGGIVSGTKVIKNDKGETIEIREYENCVRDRNGNITNGTLIYKNEDGTTKETRKYYNCTRDENNGVIDGTIEYYKEDGNETRVYDKCTRDENNHVENGTIIIYDGCGDNKTEKEKKVYKDGKLTV